MIRGQNFPSHPIQRLLHCTSLLVTKNQVTWLLAFLRLWLLVLHLESLQTLNTKQQRRKIIIIFNCLKNIVYLVWVWLIKKSRSAREKYIWRRFPIFHLWIGCSGDNVVKKWKQRSVLRSFNVKTFFTTTSRNCKWHFVFVKVSYKPIYAWNIFISFKGVMMHTISVFLRVKENS